MEVTYIAMADSHRIGARSKVDALGLFTNIGLWATPAEREVSLILGLRDVAGGAFQFSVLLRRPRKKARKLLAVEGSVEMSTRFFVTAQRVKLPFDSVGVVEIGVRVGNRSKWLPFSVHELPWPVLPEGEDLEKALKDPNRIKGGRVMVQCKKCDRRYVFEVHLNPERPLTKGSRRFPTNGKFKCGKCGTTHNIRDAQGQLLATLAGVTET